MGLVVLRNRRWYTYSRTCKDRLCLWSYVVGRSGPKCPGRFFVPVQPCIHLHLIVTNCIHLCLVILLVSVYLYHVHSFTHREVLFKCYTAFLSIILLSFDSCVWPVDGLSLLTLLCLPWPWTVSLDSDSLCLPRPLACIWFVSALSPLPCLLLLTPACLITLINAAFGS